VNDPVAHRECRIDAAMCWTNLTRDEATAQVDAELAEEEAIAKAYLRLMQAVRGMEAAA
jgi:hypothetical protein